MIYLSKLPKSKKAFEDPKSGLSFLPLLMSSLHPNTSSSVIGSVHFTLHSTNPYKYPYLSLSLSSKSKHLRLFLSLDFDGSNPLSSPNSWLCNSLLLQIPNPSLSFLSPLESPKPLHQIAVAEPPDWGGSQLILLRRGRPPRDAPPRGRHPRHHRPPLGPRLAPLRPRSLLLGPATPTPVARPSWIGRAIGQPALGWWEYGSYHRPWLAFFLLLCWRCAPPKISSFEGFLIYSVSGMWLWSRCDLFMECVLEFLLEDLYSWGFHDMVAYSWEKLV